MPRLPALTYRDVERVLRNLGFEIVRQRGSHVFFRHPDGRVTTVPNHGSQTLGRGLLRSILNDVEISRNDFMNLL